MNIQPDFEELLQLFAKSLLVKNKQASGRLLDKADLEKLICLKE